MDKFKNSLRNFMMGRYGTDQFNIFLLIFAVALSLVLNILGLGKLTIITYIPLIYSIFRSFSRNIGKRRAENVKFLKIWSPVKTWLTRRITMLRQSKQYRFFRCKKCGEYARVPRNVGTVEIRCRKCGNTFRKKA